MKILAVETSGVEGSVAVAEDDRVLVERPLKSGGRRHAQTLVSEVDQMLKELALAPGDIEGVAVSIGPGSFTGLRVGVVFAKTFAWVNQAALVAVDTLQAIALRLQPESQTVTVISDAQRGDVFTSRFVWKANLGLNECVAEVEIQSLSKFLSTSSGHGVVTGPGLVKTAEQIRSVANVADETFWQPCASTVALVGQARLLRHDMADLNSLEPLYVRRSYAEEKVKASANDRLQESAANQEPKT